MHRHDRLTQLLELLAARGHVEVDELSAELGVSEATIRRDLDHLAHQQLLTRTRGGAVVQQVAYDLPLRYKAARRADEKLRIGAVAAGLVSRGMVVGLNGGTTVTEVARAIATRPELGGTSNGSGEPVVTIVTNALNIAHELTVRPTIKLVITGGVARPQSYELIGPLAGRILDEITLDVMILGVDALDPVAGATAHHEGEAAVDRSMMERAGRVVVVADATKLGHRAFARICATDEIDTLITDTSADSDCVARFEAAGIGVMLA